MSVDLQVGMKLLKEAGYKVDHDRQTLKKIAMNNGVSPRQIYLTMAPASDQSSAFSGKSKALPATPVPGTGNLTLADFCGRYNLNVKVIIKLLKEANIASAEDMSIKKIGEVNKTSPIDVYEEIKSIFENYD